MQQLSPFCDVTLFLHVHAYFACISLGHCIMYLTVQVTFSPAAKLAVGDTLHGYTVNAVTPVPDYDLTAVQLTHDQTGAQHLHMARKDSNNAFRCVSVYPNCHN